MVLDVEPGKSNFLANPLTLEISNKSSLHVPSQSTTEEDSLTIPDVSIIESSAELLYGLVHQRFILTKAGLQAMVRPYPRSLNLLSTRDDQLI